MEQLINITDALFLGHVGEVELGASAIARIYYLAVYMLGFGFSIGLQVMIARLCISQCSWRNGKNQNHFSVSGDNHLCVFSISLLVELLYTSIFTPLLDGRISVCNSAGSAIYYLSKK